jgi:hypothetical protein
MEKNTHKIECTKAGQRKHTRLIIDFQGRQKTVTAIQGSYGFLLLFSNMKYHLISLLKMLLNY